MLGWSKGCIQLRSFRSQKLFAVSRVLSRFLFVIGRRHIVHFVGAFRDGDGHHGGERERLRFYMRMTRLVGFFSKFHFRRKQLDEYSKSCGQEPGVSIIEILYIPKPAHTFGLLGGT